MSKNNISIIENSKGLSVAIMENGLIGNIEIYPIRLNLLLATPFGKSGANLYLRKRLKSIEYKPLLGPESNSHFSIKENTFIAEGNWSGLDYVCVLQLSEESLSWQWRVEINNVSDRMLELDLIYVQDVGLKPLADESVNEYYISQYLDRLIFDHDDYGSVICCRQNLKVGIDNPWLMLACKNSAIAASVDGMQFFGSTYRETGIPEGLLAEKLTGEYAGELSVIALQEKPFKLAPNDTHNSKFVVTYLADHPLATSKDDLRLLPALINDFDSQNLPIFPGESLITCKNIFNTSPALLSEDLSVDEIDLFFGEERRNSEEENGQLLSFFCKQRNHIILRRKEVMVDRPHAHIMMAKAGYTPDENIMTTTSYAYGVFNSHITQGNTNYNRLLSVCSSQFNLEPHTGQRIFIELEGKLSLLCVPSAFEMGLNHCRWIYKHAGYCFQVRSWTSKSTSQVNMDFKVITGGSVKLLVTHHFDESNGWHFTSTGLDNEFVIKPNIGSFIANKFPQAQFRMLINSEADYEIGGNELLYGNNKNHGDSFAVISALKTSDFSMSFVGEVCHKTRANIFSDNDKQFFEDCQDARAVWQDLTLDLSLRGGQDIAVIQEILPWYGMNALTHLLTPHGLEQFDGAAWGTRDTAQGPFELLMSMRKFDESKQILRIMFSNQNADGGWPQWWMFDSYSNIRGGSSHDDVYHWCIIALSTYIKATGDVAFLGEVLPYYHEDGVDAAEKTPLGEHVDRLINMIVESFIPGTSLVPFGGGDWNDSMQPANKELAQRLISCWTVELNYQAFNDYLAVCEHIGRRGQANKLQDICKKVKADFNQHLIKDGVVAGHGLIEEDGSISLLLHPSDNKTNIQYRLLPMIRGIISGIFTAKQAERHQSLIEQYLKGPDGARLMNRPPRYNGGIQTFFQRAESSSFFGREIGLMYMHAHLRYAESQARMGKADNFIKALRQATPIAYRDVVPCGDIRQSNCYYSSSDIIFRNRYEADEQYEGINAGGMTVKGGWRIYSSGPGIYISLIVSRLLGLREAFGNTIIDPVISHSMDGLSASIQFMDYPVTFIYTVKEDCVSPKTIFINGKPIAFNYEENQYRSGGAVIPTDQFMAMLNKRENTIEIQL